MPMMPNNEDCEVWDAAQAQEWRLVRVEDALLLGREVRKRCPECHGRVRAHKLANNGMRAHIEHVAKHSGCSRGSNFSGRPSIHPLAVG
jgi:hypothetical protein